MFSEDRRSQLLTALIDAARSDVAVTGAALVGSLARREADRWSDVDLVLRLAPEVEMHDVVDQWSEVMQEHGPVTDHLDIAAGDGLYRVFLLSESLQVDLSRTSGAAARWDLAGPANG